MDQKNNINQEELDKFSKTNLLAILSQLKGKSLFPKRIEAAKKMLIRARLDSKTP